MILLATNKRDITTDFIVLELQRRGRPFLRLNTEDLPQAAVSFQPSSPDGWTMKIEDKTWDLSTVRAAYYRRPGEPVPRADVVDDHARAYCAAEWSAVLRSLWNAFEDRWFNCPFAILRAEDKPRQLALARAIGFEVPETLITNDFERAKIFVDTGEAIGKPIRTALLERGPQGEVLFSSRIDALGPNDRGAVSLAPLIYQREIRKRCDVRATVVGDHVFAAAIESQAFEETQVDWRKGTRPDLRHEILALPADIEARCIALTRRLGLGFGAIDLIEDEDRRFWFLEINPNGQWAWIERRTGLPIASAIVDRLEEIAR